MNSKNGFVVAGSGAKSKRTFLFGSFEALIKLVPGNSAGTVMAYYVWFNINLDYVTSFDISVKLGRNLYI